MIQYRVYNPKSPLDAIAATWARQNAELFPLGNVVLGMPDIDIVIGGRRGKAVGSSTAPGGEALTGTGASSETLIPALDSDDLLVTVRGGAGND
jgi:hypothetical protein